MARKVGVGGGAINADPTVKYRPCSSAARPATTSFTYDSASRRTALTLPNGVLVNYTYSQAAQLTGITYQMGSTTLGNLTYGYDNDGRVTSVGGSFARTGLPQGVSSATYDAANELTQWGTQNLTYDSDGNLLTDGVNTYTWDARNQLASVNAGNVFNFQYDAFGRRITNPSGNSLLYDGGNAVQELSGGSAVANRLAGGIDEFFNRTDSTGAFSPLADALGSTVALTDCTGALQTQYTYEPFGNTTVSGPGNANPYQYTGRENDGVGLYYYRARYYSPIYQRFISEDPLRFAGGDVNVYRYASDDPANGVDPWGLWYFDFNLSGGYWLGFTGGVQINGSGFFFYAGGGIVSPGVSASVTWSPSNPTPGWSVAVQGQAGAAAQVGYSFGQGGGPFWEVGLGYPPGFSVTAYYTFSPWNPYDPANGPAPDAPESPNAPDRAHFPLPAAPYSPSGWNPFSPSWPRDPNTPLPLGGRKNLPFS